MRIRNKNHRARRNDLEGVADEHGMIGMSGMIGTGFVRTDEGNTE